MSGFLQEMARSTLERVTKARSLEPQDALWQRASEAPAAPPLNLSASGFDVMAELKLRSPAAGVLRTASEDICARVAAYADGGAAAVSVLTEPYKFDGSMAHLARASETLAPRGVPTLRKDFIIDSYQVMEARALGAGGVLVILRLLDHGRIVELLDCAAMLRMDSAGLDSLGPSPQTVFRASIDTRSVDLTRAPFRRDQARWGHRSDYSATQEFAAVARAADAGAIRYASVRDPEHAAAVAVLRADAFKPPRPIEQVTWFLTLKPERVIWRREGETFEFDANAWK